MLEQDQVTLELPENQKGKKKPELLSEDAPEDKFSLTRCQKVRILCGYESFFLLLLFLGVITIHLVSYQKI